MYRLNNIYNEELQIIGTTETITRVSDNAHIPLNPDNYDYQQYLKWLEEGNTPLPADELAAQQAVQVKSQPTVSELQAQLADISAQLQALKATS